MKKAILSMVFLLTLSLFAGCKQEKSKEQPAEQKIKVTSRSDTESTSSLPAKNSTEKTKEKTGKTAKSSMNDLWSTDKSAKLQEFMSSWGQTMGQTYKAYYPKQSVDFYGLDLPDGVIEGTKTQPMAVDEQIVTGEWSETGTSSSEYSIVAVYSDAETAPYAAKHVYFFAFHDQQPLVLVSMQNQGMPDKAFHFSETENQELKNGFLSIVNGGTVAAPKADQSANTWRSMDEAMAFYEAVYKNPENNLEMIWENYDRKCWSLVEQSGNRMVLHWANIGGAGGSYDEFLKNGETTQLIVYGGNAAYPNDPSVRYTIQNEGHKVIQAENLYEK
ncbi:DUF4767 domain-containing protein [Candidatus Enterococcus murrayae]|uniref:DUF4767 domain-containing protein n=1 Tax=Candidatus Enterococcus murrayae TaxID=2815321 RepID=A0ABS3HID1_9ENTE|nr:DUF4767 domain-containing protein [Enterococcus sp. MJM16]MBO0453220.1 DUF4767 domain-containing protein [Enterococcus sp. MJM16]